MVTVETTSLQSVLPHPPTTVRLHDGVEYTLGKADLNFFARVEDIVNFGTLAGLGTMVITAPGIRAALHALLVDGDPRCRNWTREDVGRRLIYRDIQPILTVLTQIIEAGLPPRPEDDEKNVPTEAEPSPLTGPASSDSLPSNVNGDLIELDASPSERL